jgi:hypothetical protein
MVELFDATAAWLLQVSQYPCGSIFAMGWLRVLKKDFI